VDHATPLEYERVFRTNLLGVIYGAKAFLPRLLRQRSGHIVNISSVLAQVALPTQSAYCASKSAVSAFTECLARECEGSGVAVSLVIPAGIRTEFAANAVITQAAGPEELAIRTHLARFLRRDPAKIARRILAGVAARKGRIPTGRDAALIDWFSRLLPKTFPRLFLYFLAR
jgi:short-subunit dehydrogenase